MWLSPPSRSLDRPSREHFFGSRGGTRTPNQTVNGRLLYRLSYPGLDLIFPKKSLKRITNPTYTIELTTLKL